MIAGRTLAIAVLAAAVLGGVSAGIALDRWLLLPGDAEAAAAPDPGRATRAPGGARREGRRGFPSPEWERQMRDRLSDELGLTAEQRARFDSLLTRQARDFRAIREEMQPRIDSLLAHTRVAMDSILTPAQQEKLRTLRHGTELGGPLPPFLEGRGRGRGGPHRGDGHRRRRDAAPPDSVRR
ncbi:MAG TPA: hypothetical protein VFS08_10680 [Gemmatimonadaceae bacterium]|nr:hypothetical protein [Gemmatimonadaceae bacterium]